MLKRFAALILASSVFFSVLPAPLPLSAARSEAAQRASGEETSKARVKSNAEAEAKSALASSQVRVERALDTMPLYFIENQGQIDRRASFYVQGRDQTVYFSPQGVTFALSAVITPTLPTLPPEEESPDLQAVHAERPTGQIRQRWVVKLDFVGANPDVKPVGESPTETVISYFKGRPSQWQVGIPTFAHIRYADLWPGIDLVYSGQVDELKYEFVVQPGADPAQIQLAYRGANQVRLTEGGQLAVSTPLGGFQDAAPLAYQVRDGERQPVEMHYALNPSEVAGEQAYHRYGFDLGAYDTSLPLMLDPAVIVYAGFIGGDGTDYSGDIAVDSAGNAYITGTTYSGDTFPVTVGPDLTPNGTWDAFVVKLNASGSALIYAGFIGGAEGASGEGIALDSQGNAYITGRTDSDETTFPVIGGPDLTFNSGDFGSDAFVAKVNAAGTALLYAGYIGGSEADGGNSIAVDANGNAYVTGYTRSTESSFPVLVGPDLTFNSTLSTHLDGFVAKVNSAGTGLVYAGYIGGSRSDTGNDIAVDEQGNAYIGADFDGTGVVEKVNAAGSGLVYTYEIPGQIFGIALDDDGNAYITGQTGINETYFPVLVGPDLTHNGSNDAFVAKLNATGTALLYAGYIGGSATDYGASIAVDAGGNAYIVGETQSDQTNFPVREGPDLTYNGARDVFVAMVNPAGSQLIYAGYIGGAGEESAVFNSGVAVNSTGNAYLIGITYSTESTFPEKGGPDLTYNGGGDIFVAKVGAGGAGPADLSVSRMELLQGITMSDGYIVHIAHRPAMLRAFIALEGSATLAGVTGRLTRYTNGVAQDSLNIGPITVENDIFEGLLLHTMNFNIPASWLFPGTEYVLQIDPGNTIAESNESNNRYPASGRQSFHFVNTPVLNIVIVPVTYARPGAPVTTPQMNDLTYLTWMPAQVYPVAQINYTVRSTQYTFTGDLREDSGWSQLLDEITEIHAVEDPSQSKIYYGLVDSIAADGCISCIGGTAWLNSPTTPLLKTAVGIATLPSDPDFVSRALAHEVGHTYGRRHAPCGLFVDFYVDTNYPYRGQYGDGGAPIGQWGYDAESSQLILPTTKDYMSYCSPAWTSDYTYYGIYWAFSWVEGWEIELPYKIYLPSTLDGGSSARMAASASSQSLSLSGMIAPDGSLQVGPLFRGRGPTVISNQDNRYQVVLLDAAGNQLASVSLELTEVAIEQIGAGEMGAGFRASLPLVQGLTRVQIHKDGALVFERGGTRAAPALGPLARIDNAQGEALLSWSASEGAGELFYRVLYSADGGATWQLLAANTAQPNLAVPAELLQGAHRPVLLVQASNGVQTDERIYELATP